MEHEILKLEKNLELIPIERTRLNNQSVKANNKIKVLNIKNAIFNFGRDLGGSDILKVFLSRMKTRPPFFLNSWCDLHAIRTSVSVRESI